MKLLKIACAASGLALISTPVVAQSSGPDSYQFIQAVQKRDGDTATQLIADHPTVINARDGKGDTALIIAIKGSDRDWTAFLIDKGADVNQPGAGGDTPLITAARFSFDDAADWLLDRGARADASNRSGETPLIVAVQQRDTRLVRILLDRGADPDHTDAVAGYSARDYANRDPRARDIQKLINDKKPKPPAK